MPVPRPGILDLPPYPLADRSAPGASQLIHLASNECASNPSPLAVAAYQEAVAGLRRYPDAASDRLIEGLAEHHGLDAARIVCGAGSEELIYLLARAYCGPGDEVVLAHYGYMLFRIAAQLAGATPVLAGGPSLAPDLAAMAKAITPRTRLLFIANPNNPTGHCVSRAEIERLWRQLPEHVLLVLDAAYAEYVKRNDYESGLALAAPADNIVVLRTFSKVYGLASLRIGWAYAPPPVAEVLHRVRAPTNVSGPAQATAAAALQDQAHVSRIVASNARNRVRFTAMLEQSGLAVAPSQANFVLARFSGAQAAAVAFAHLKSQGVIARPMAAYGLNEYLRFTIGLSEEMDIAVEALKLIL